MRNLPGKVRRHLGLEPAGPAPTRAASFSDWRTAVALAHAKLCQGDGYHVLHGEPWVLALVRVAALLLDAKGFGRKHGVSAPDEWANFATEVARWSSTSSDGCIAVGPSGLRVPLSGYPRGLAPEA